MASKKKEPSSPKPRKKPEALNPEKKAAAGETPVPAKAPRGKRAPKPKAPEAEASARKRASNRKAPSRPAAITAGTDSYSLPRSRPVTARSTGHPIPGTALRILMITPEAHPFAKTGGLAEVAAALPAGITLLTHALPVVIAR